MSNPDAESTDSPFDRLHMAITGNAAFREAIRASSPDLPDWLTPASVIDIGDLKYIAAAMDVRPGDTIVDLGCGGGGPGLWIAERSGASLVGVDASAIAIRSAEALAESRSMASRARFQRADLSATGLPDECAGGIMCLDVLMFVEPRSAVREIGRLIRRGGIVVARAVESLVEPFMPTLVRDYRPIFEEARFTIVHREEVADFSDRSLTYFQAIADRADAMRAEIGAAADILIGMAADSLARAKKPPRVRTVYVVARR